MGPIELSFDISAALPAAVTGGKPTRIAAWLFLPDDPALIGDMPVAMTLLAGGSYDKRYWHIEIPGRHGYSAAEYLAARGNFVLAADHLGVGGSTRVPDQTKATRQIVALAMHAAVEQFHARLRDGSLHPSLPALPALRRIGAGHSMGGMLVTIQQANHRSYDAIMVLGYTADGVHMTMQGRKFRAAELVPPDMTYPDYTTNDRAPLHEGFHWDDVPRDVIAADDALAVETPSRIGAISISTGIIREEAAAIDVPVYFCNAERDVSPDINAEAALFGACPDFTAHMLPRSGHCQNFASTRAVMWDRMHHWARTPW